MTQQTPENDNMDAVTDENLTDAAPAASAAQDDTPEGRLAAAEAKITELQDAFLRAKADAVSKAATAIEADFSLTEEWIDLLADRLPASGRALCGAPCWRCAATAAAAPAVAAPSPAGLAASASTQAICRGRQTCFRS